MNPSNQATLRPCVYIHETKIEKQLCLLKRKYWSYIQLQDGPLRFKDGQRDTLNKCVLKCDAEQGPDDVSSPLCCGGEGCSLSRSQLSQSQQRRG